MIAGATSVTQKGQVTLPKAVRDRLRVSRGDKVLFEIRGDEVVLRPGGRESVVDILKRSGPWGVDPVRFQRELRREWKL